MLIENHYNNLGKTNNFIDDHCKTFGKAESSLKIIAKPQENQCFQSNPLEIMWKAKHYISEKPKY